MYLESFTIKNYRKFGENNNTVYFVNANEICHSPDNNDGEIKPLISPSSTLIIGKNNAGKTTITNALTFITEAKNKPPKSSDFNVYYLKKLLEKYNVAYQENSSFDNLLIPKLEFILKIKIDSSEYNDLITNLSNFITLSNDSLEEPIEIKVIYELKDSQNFYKNIKRIISETETEQPQADDIFKINIQLEKLCELLDDKTIVEYKVTYKNINDTDISSFSLHNLFSIKNIRANRHLNENVLSSVFQRIVSSQFEDDNSKNLFKGDIETINKTITERVQGKNESVSTILKKIEQGNHVGMQLRGNVTQQSILRNLIKYSFTDGDDFIPEDQFGLGYVNLLNIIGEIIHYIDTYEENSHQSRINLLFIEEPEIFMHPQMQEFFISRIDNAVHKALELANFVPENKKSLQCQIVVTTHSSHIVNSKIHSCNSFNNINYLTIKDKYSIAIPLNDKNILEENSPTKENDILFLKKHIKYKVSELFFSDAIIFVEGATEETLLHYYLEQNNILNNYYISIFRIDGAHSKVYFPLIKRLNIPCLIITDLDIKRYCCEKKKQHKKDDPVCPTCNNDDSYPIGYAQITSLDDRQTTNATLLYFAKNAENSISLREMTDYIEKDFLYVVYQKDSIEGQFATSLEEAIILTNHENVLLHNLISNLKPIVYKEITNGGVNKEQLKGSSFRLQQSLGNNSGKSEFASKLLYELITSDDAEKPKLPKYIKDGFSWLENKLRNEV